MERHPWNKVCFFVLAFHFLHWHPGKVWFFYSPACDADLKLLITDITVHVIESISADPPGRGSARLRSFLLKVIIGRGIAAAQQSEFLARLELSAEHEMELHGSGRRLMLQTRCNLLEVYSLAYLFTE